MLRIVTSPNAVQDDHRELLALVDSLRRRLDGPAWEDPMVGSLLDSLVSHLEAHFQGEEVDGFFDEVLELAPQASSRIDALVNEHQRMLTVADDLCHRYLRARRTPANWRFLGDAFQRLRQMLLVHECDERHLLQEVFTQDEGSKD